MTKTELENEVYAALKADGVSRAESDDALRLVLGEIKLSLAAGESVILRGFGRWLPRVKTARIGRNPKSGESVGITARRVVAFRPGKGLRQAVNNGTPRGRA